MRRSAPPADFRYVRLLPGPSATQVIVGAGLAATVPAVVVGYVGAPAQAAIASLLAGGVAALFFGRQTGPLLPRIGATPASMAIVPWGVLVEPDEHAETAARVLRWAAIEQLTIDFVHQQDAHGSPIAWSIVTVATQREKFVGRAFGIVGLERLTALVEQYAEQSSAPPAIDLLGETPATHWPIDPCVPELLDAAQQVISSPDGIDLLALCSSGFRDQYESSSSTAERLKSILSERNEGADSRALAALVTAELQVKELGPTLVRLATDVHPLVALCARGAALRLGEDLTKCGALDELSQFVHAEDLEVITDWANQPAAGNE